MSSIESIGNLEGEIDRYINGQRITADMLLQGLPLQKLHDDETPSLLLPDVVDGADVGVVHRGSGAGLTYVAIDMLRVPGDLGRDKLKSDVTMKARILGFPHHTHPAFTDLLDQAVVLQSLTRLDVHALSFLNHDVLPGRSK
jgi:hypothetical protein